MPIDTTLDDSNPLKFDEVKSITATIEHNIDNNINVATCRGHQLPVNVYRFHKALLANLAN